MRVYFYSIFTFFFATVIYCQESFYDESQLGLYNTFYDFVMTKRTGKESIYLDSAITEKGEWSNYYFKTPKYRENNNKVKNIWGYTDGKNSYVYYESEFFKLFREKDYLCFIGFGLPNTTAAVAGGMAGGIVGATVGTAVADANARKRQHKYYIDENTGRIFTSIETLNDYRAKNVMGELIIYRMSKKEKSDPVSFKIDKENYSFIPNSYLHLEIPYTYMPVEIECLDSMSELKKMRFPLKENEPVYVMCEYSSKIGKVRFVQVDIQTGRFDSHKPQKAQKKRDKLQNTAD